MNKLTECNLAALLPILMFSTIAVHAGNPPATTTIMSFDDLAGDWMEVNTIRMPFEQRGVFCRLTLKNTTAMDKAPVAATELATRWAKSFDRSFELAKTQWEDRWQAAFTPGNKHFSGHLPTLLTDDLKIRRVYYEGVLAALMLCRTDLPAAKRCFVTAGPQWAVTLMYFWDTEMWANSWAMLEPTTMKELLAKWLAVDGGENISSTAGTTESRVFSVLKYGAVGDDKTDNTEAFSACLKAVIAAGGGKMVLPAGVYQGRITIPPVSKPLPSWITVEIVGESEPTPVFGTIGSFPLQNNGTIIKSLAKSGPAVIAASSSPDSVYGGFSAIHVVIKNLDVRSYDDPGIGGIDLQYALQCKLENVFINTGVYNVQASKPTHSTSGLTTPACNNAALTILRNVVVTGYHTGIVVNEHTDGDNIVVASNINGLKFVSAHHASRFGRVGTYRNTHHLAVSGRHGFSIEQMNTEQPGPGQTDARNAWQALVSDIDDPKNLGIADINYWVVEGNVGAVEKFTRNGGASIRARRIGSAPAATK